MDDEELPDLDINGSGSNGGSWRMPSAAELAAQRALEAARERKIALLREVGGAGGLAGARAMLQDCNFSSSEGEALSNTLESLRVKSGGGRREREERVSAGQCLRALRRLLAPGAGADDWLQALLELADDPAALTDALDEFIGVVEGHAGAWRGAEALCAAAVLSARCVCAAGAAGGAGAAGERARRRSVPRAAAALHRLLDENDDEDLRQGLVRWALSCLPPPALLALGDAARAGGGGGGGELARSLARAAAAAALRPQDPPLQVFEGDEAVRIMSLSELTLSVRGAYPALPPRRQELLLAAAGRALAGGAGGGAGGAGGGGAALLGALRAAAGAAPRRHEPDCMKVLVTASKLQLLLAPEPPAAPATHTSSTTTLGAPADDAGC